MDKRLKQINLQLSEYSKGQFDKKLGISDRYDEIDAVINGINMMAEELETITISKNYFNSIFNSVSDMVFVLNSKGIIEDVNELVSQQLGYATEMLKGVAINKLHGKKTSLFNQIQQQLKAKQEAVFNESMLVTKAGGMIHVKLTATHFKKEAKKNLVLLTASDISYQVKTKEMIIRAIIDTQENERTRLAKDIHDSLTQQLSAIKFYISSIGQNVKDKKELNILHKSNEALAAVITDMRDVCFNLMPKTLKEFGLIKAVKEFCNQFWIKNKVQVIIRQSKLMPVFSPELDIDLYRIIQEFINNATRHGKADKINIVFRANKKELRLFLKDNGTGFNISEPCKGMGLQNVQSRVTSHAGTLDIESNAGKGTSYFITVPFNN